jgi:predicted AlkP superfamily pyrophosphatase or phosphodiesterase
MRKCILTGLILCLAVLSSVAQKSVPKKPKLIVGVVVDQMRWDYLYRYSDRYNTNGGFNRLLTQGFSNENTLIPYTPTITACGHTCIYSGSVPAVHGIMGNNWYDQTLKKVVYCTEDPTVKTVGSTTAAGEMSPANLLTTTITDELRLASNFRSKVIGVAIKDRGAILPAGHSANAAYWYDNKTGNWITSTYYRNDLPGWLSGYNSKKPTDKFYKEGWNTLYPLNSYGNSSSDEQVYEGKPFGSAAKGFPYDLKGMIGKNFGAICSTPFGNTMTLQVAEAAIEGEQLGKGAFTDFLTVSLSATDYIGHAFGPNSIEAEDGFLRLDQDLGAFLDYLDKQVGNGEYLLFISADHGVAHVPAFMKEHKIPAGLFDDLAVVKELNADLNKQFGSPTLVLNSINYQLHLNNPLIDSMKLNRKEIIKKAISFMKKQPGVARVFELEALPSTILPTKIKEMVTNGYMPTRSGDIQFILFPQVIDGGPAGTTHGLWNPYDAHIPLVWYGWNIKPGKSNAEVYMTDIAPTIAAMLQIQMPNGCVGKPIESVLR